jgi:hypothetical protein
LTVRGFRYDVVPPGGTRRTLVTSFDPRTLRHLTNTRTNRRRLLQGGAALGLGAALPLVGRGGSAAAQDATVLSFYHDKSPWQDFFIEMGELAQAAIGINWEPTPYSDVTTYQAALLQSLPTDDAPDFFTWWSGYRIESLWSNGVLQDVSDIWTQAVADGNLPESLGGASPSTESNTPSPPMSPTGSSSTTRRSSPITASMSRQHGMSSQPPPIR